jgi:3-hydroxybutyrate dehydrogenase
VAGLRGKCALVTGATGGLGYAVAERLAAEGCHVIVNGLAPPDEMTAAIDHLREGREISVIYMPADLREPGEIDAMMASAAARFGAVDILVNNAVVRHFAPVEAFPVERWNEALAVNLSAAFHTIRLAMPAMRRRGWGRIINMASPYSFFAAPHRVDYVTTKTALLGLTRAVAIEAAGTDITCNAICPGTLPTPAIEARIAAMAADKDVSVEEATRLYLADRQPGGRFISMESVAALAAFLCGPSSREISGAALPVDSAWTVS